MRTLTHLLSVATKVEHVLATSTIQQKKASNMLVRVEGTLGVGVTSKDIVLHLCGVIGTAGGTGSTIEFAGETIRSLSMEVHTPAAMQSLPEH